MIKNMSEQERREAALAAFGGEVLDAREVRSKEVRQMVSVRMEPELVSGLRDVAVARGVKVSDLLRDAAARIISDSHRSEPMIQSVWTTVMNPVVQPLVKISQWDGSPALGMSYQQKSA